jgi:hypothetical protein
MQQKPVKLLQNHEYLTVNEKEGIHHHVPSTSKMKSMSKMVHHPPTEVQSKPTKVRLKKRWKNVKFSQWSNKLCFKEMSQKSRKCEVPKYTKKFKFYKKRWFFFIFSLKWNSTGCTLKTSEKLKQLYKRTNTVHFLAAEQEGPGDGRPRTWECYLLQSHRLWRPIFESLKKVLVQELMLNKWWKRNLSAGRRCEKFLRFQCAIQEVAQRKNKFVECAKAGVSSIRMRWIFSSSGKLGMPCAVISDSGAF